ncbi:MAG: hypothetical protein ACI4W6_01695 [Acutalibacteraceae bacterium]
MILYSKTERDKTKELDLDTSAKLYTYTKTKDLNQTFRVSALLKEKVQPELLAKAIKLCQKRFPSFYVQLRNGFFWKKLETKSFQSENILIRDTQCCRPINFDNKHAPLFRVLYSDYRISLEVFHGITDGHGAITFFKTLLAVYFNLSGIPVPATNGVLDINEKPEVGELEDASLKYYSKEFGYLSRNEASAYQYKPETEDNGLNIMQGRFSVQKIKEIIHLLNVSVTEYLTAAYIYSFYLNILDKERAKPIKVQVPIDLRPFYHSNTLRNFSLYVNVGIDPKKCDCDFSEILSQVKQQIRAGKEMTRLQKMLNSNVRDGEMMISKYSPSFLKKPFIKAGFLLYGERLFTSPMSNLGVIKVPKEMETYIESFDFVIGKTFKNNIWATVVSFKDCLTVTFSSKDINNKIAGTFIDFLHEQGISDYCDSTKKLKKSIRLPAVS